MDPLKTKMHGSNESQREEQMEVLISVPQQVAQKARKEEDVMNCNSIVRTTQQMAHCDIKTNMLYINAMKRVQLFLETNSNFTDNKTFIHETVSIMKILGKMLEMRNSMREELDVMIMCHIKNLTKKKDVDISIIEEVSEKIKHLRNSDVGVQTDMQLHQIKQTKRHEQREQGEGNKRKEILSLEDDKVQQKRKKIAQSGVKKNFRKREESGTVGQKQGLPESSQQRYTTSQRSKVYASKGSTVNEGHLRGELSNGFLEQLEAMQQLVQQLRTRLLFGADNQQTMNKNKIMDSVMQEFKLMRHQKKKAKRQQQGTGSNGYDEHASGSSSQGLGDGK